jgi:hypothetical protein
MLSNIQCLERTVRTGIPYLTEYPHKFPERWIVIDSSKRRCMEDTYPYAKQREMQAQHRMLLKISTQETCHGKWNDQGMRACRYHTFCGKNTSLMYFQEAGHCRSKLWLWVCSQIRVSRGSYHPAWVLGAWGKKPTVTEIKPDELSFGNPNKSF